MCVCVGFPHPCMGVIQKGADDCYTHGGFTLWLRNIELEESIVFTASTEQICLCFTDHFQLTAGMSFNMQTPPPHPPSCQDRPLILSNRQLKSFLLEESQFFPHCLRSQKHTGQKFREALFKMASWFCYGNC